MAFQLHQITKAVFVVTPTTRDVNASSNSYTTLAQAAAAQQALGGKNDSINGAYWNSCVFDTNNSVAPVLPFPGDED
jgi:hypothetical protein